MGTTKNPTSRLGLILGLYRRHTGQSVRDLAPDIGLSRSTLSRLENGRGMDARALVKVMDWLLDKK
jgi:transcriptional regulator with XRE-family HTH domain